MNKEEKKQVSDAIMEVFPREFCRDNPNVVPKIFEFTQKLNLINETRYFQDDEDSKTVSKTSVRDALMQLVDAENCSAEIAKLVLELTIELNLI